MGRSCEFWGYRITTEVGYNGEAHALLEQPGPWCNSYEWITVTQGNFTMSSTDIPWNLRPVADHGYIIPELIEMSVDRLLVGELGFFPMIWFWLWLWLGLKRDEGVDDFYYSDHICAFSEQEYNIAVAMDSGPSYAADWLEWVVAFPIPGYAIREASNY